MLQDVFKNLTRSNTS